MRNVVSTRRISAAVVGALAGVLAVASPAWAVVLNDFVVFGDGDVTIAKSFSVLNGGLIGSNDDLQLGRNADVFGAQGGGDLLVGRSSQLDGDLIFNGDVFLKKNVHVLEDVDAGDELTLGKNSVIDGNATAGGAIALQAGASVGGTTTPFDAPQAFTPILLPPATIFSAGGPDVTKGKNQTTTLSPGVYGALTLSRNNTLNLSSGTYFFDSIQGGKNLTLNIDLSSGGPIQVFIIGDVSFGKHLDVHLTGGSASQVYFESGGSWFTGRGANWFGTVYTPNGNALIKKGATFTGALYSGETIHIGSHSTFVYEPRTGPLVPEPSSVWLMGTGLASLLGLAGGRHRLL